MRKKQKIHSEKGESIRREEEGEQASDERKRERERQREKWRKVSMFVSCSSVPTPHFLTTISSSLIITFSLVELNHGLTCRARDVELAVFGAKRLASVSFIARTSFTAS